MAGPRCWMVNVFKRPFALELHRRLLCTLIVFIYHRFIYETCDGRAVAYFVGCKEEGKLEMTSARDKPGNLI